MNRLVQPLVSSQVVGGYVVHGDAEYLPPDDYTYSDTGMFLDDASGMIYELPVILVFGRIY